MDWLTLVPEPAGFFAFVTSLALHIVTSRFIYPAWEILSLNFLRSRYSRLRRKFGILQALLLVTILPDATHIVDRVERHVLGAETQDVMALRKSTSEDCTMLAVAAAIVAQIAITALGLEGLDQVHWTANAAFVLSLTAGGLSVFYACLVQQRMSSLFTADDVRDFFSKASSPEQLRYLEDRLDRLVSEIRGRPGDRAADGHPRIKEVKSMIAEFRRENRWKSASFHSILMVKAPTLLLKYALASFVIGLGIYFGSLAFSEVDTPTPRRSHRAIFIVYIVASFLGLLIYYVPATLKELELSPARRYAQMVTNELSTTPDWEETEMIQTRSAELRLSQPGIVGPSI
ncbi:hypothetical protein BDW62DRAFT_186065 [Aspergillus aurantiobrunneus]